MGFTVIPIEKVRAALARAEELGAAGIEEACAAAAQSLGIAVESVREVAYELADQDAGGDAA
ncbi:hypothetical protein C7T35_01210 [Variovorax sp. WS11]|uniref:hypothetical protein n=1 Tax=Variovorax sp. WS11 TaxID=1105204 RepID=UPI000D0DAC10|nr:hypothetical protein [Variovorax sp. WS11]NDZ11531.1 hypothetical protein [Variovorax sp. WS11]PSL86615.1 hypothetical protein C7T35_01210 [Variovorax sp. WS11]